MEVDYLRRLLSMVTTRMARHLQTIRISLRVMQGRQLDVGLQRDGTSVDAIQSVEDTVDSKGNEVTVNFHV